MAMSSVERFEAIRGLQLLLGAGQCRQGDVVAAVQTGQFLPPSLAVKRFHLGAGTAVALVLFNEEVTVGHGSDLRKMRHAHDLLAAGNGIELLTHALRGDAGKLCRKAAVVSGGGGIDSIYAALDAQCDVLITGEMEHIMHHAALECGVAVIALGHYASETTGPRALMAHVQKNFPQLETVFAESPTGL